LFCHEVRLDSAVRYYTISLRKDHFRGKMLIDRNTAFTRAYRFLLNAVFL